MDPKIEALKPKERFTDRVDAYIRYRPHYPKEIIPYLGRTIGLKKENIIADIGSGTGFLSELFLENGNYIYCVDPNEAMRDAGDDYLRKRFTNFASVNGSAEDSTLKSGSVDVVTAAQAFHWFDHAKFRDECRRILRGPKWVVLVWNMRGETESPFLREYERIVKEFGQNYGEIRGKHSKLEEITKFFEGRTPEIGTFEAKQVFDFEGVRGRLLSSSYIPGEGSPRFNEMMAEVREQFDRYSVSGTIDMPHVTKVYSGRV